MKSFTYAAFSFSRVPPPPPVDALLSCLAQPLNSKYSYTQSPVTCSCIHGLSIRENLGGVFQIMLELRFNSFGSMSGKISRRSGDMGFSPNSVSM